MTRSWTPEERDVIDAMPRQRMSETRFLTKLTREQVLLLKERLDSLTMPWTLDELAREFGVSAAAIWNVAKRRRWADRYYEPYPYWKQRQEK